MESQPKINVIGESRQIQAEKEFSKVARRGECQCDCRCRVFDGFEPDQPLLCPDCRHIKVYRKKTVWVPVWKSSWYRLGRISEDLRFQNLSENKRKLIAMQDMEQEQKCRVRLSKPFYTTLRGKLQSGGVTTCKYVEEPLHGDVQSLIEALEVVEELSTHLQIDHAQWIIDYLAHSVHYVPRPIPSLPIGGLATMARDTILDALRDHPGDLLGPPIIVSSLNDLADRLFQFRDISAHICELDDYLQEAIRYWRIMNVAFVNMGKFPSEWFTMDGRKLDYRNDFYKIHGLLADDWDDVYSEVVSHFNEIRLAPLNDDNQSTDYTSLDACMRDLKRQILACRRLYRRAELLRLTEQYLMGYQSDSMESKLLDTIVLGGSMIADTIIPGSGNIVKAVGGAVGQGILRSFAEQDSPAVIVADNTNLAISDVPRETDNLVFHRDDVTGDQSHIIQIQDNMRMHSIVERCKIPSRGITLTWNTTDAVGTELMSVPVTPILWAPDYSTTDTENTFYALTTPGFFGNFFRYWRGSLKYTFEPVATGFHGGQLYITYQPNNAASDLAASTGLVSATMDLTAGSITELVVPYFSKSQYKRTGDPDKVQKASNGQLSFKDYLSGTVNVFVQNALIAPPAVPPKVYINMYISVGDDFEFAVPTQPSGSFIIDGTLQSEVVHAEAVQSVIEKPETGISTSSEDSVIAECAHADSATTSNVFGREYLITTNVQWQATQVNGTTVYELKLPDEFTSDAQLASTGLIAYHEFMRMGFEVRFRLAATNLMAGMLMMYYDPLPSNNVLYSYYMPTLTQFPHTKLNLATETEITLQIPYTQYNNLLNTTDKQADGPGASLGTVRIVVWNQLSSPTGGPVLITGAVWIKPLNPYIGLKRIPDSVTFQAGKIERDTTLSDANQNKVTVSESFVGNKVYKKGGYIATKHDNVIDLLKRPEHCYSAVLSFATTGIQRIIQSGTIASKIHRILCSTYTYRSGSNRFIIKTNASAFNQLQLLAWTTYDEDQWQTSMTAWSGTQTLDTLSMEGTAVWNANLTDRSVQFAYYNNWPICQTPSNNNTNYTTNENYDYAIFRVASIRGESTINPECLINVWHQAGDDFNLYFPRALGPMRLPKYVPPTPPPPAELEREDSFVVLKPTLTRAFRGGKLIGYQQSGWIRDLTTEGVEPNPGPWMMGGNQVGVDQVSTFSRCFSGLLSNITRSVSSDIGSTIVDSAVKKFLEEVPIVIGRVATWIAEFVVSLYTLFFSRNTVITSAALISLTAKILSITGQDGPHLLQKLKEVAAKIVYQSDDYNVYVGLVASVVVTALLSILGWKASQSDEKTVKRGAIQKWSEYMANIGKIGSGVTGIQKIWAATKAALQFAVDFTMKGTSVWNEWYDAEKLAAWQAKYDSLVVNDAFSSNGIMKKTDGRFNRDHLRELREYAMEVRQNGPFIKYFPQGWMKTAETIINLETKLASTSTPSSRTQPVGICLSGPPGVGKSFLATAILAPLIAHKLANVDFEAARALVYTVPTDPNQTYMDGYAGHPVVTIDDFGQSRTEEDLAKIFAFISTSTCPVSMAHLEDKSTRFTSDVVVATTNRLSFDDASSIFSPQALARRFEFSYTVSVKDHYKTSDKLDMKRFVEKMKECKSQEEFCALVDDVWSLKPNRLSNKEAHPKAMTVSELYNSVVSRVGVMTGFDKEVIDVMSNIFVSNRTETEPKQLSGRIQMFSGDNDADVYSDAESCSEEQAQHRRDLMLALEYEEGDRFVYDTLKVAYRMYGYSSYEDMRHDAASVHKEDGWFSWRKTILPILTKYTVEETKSQNWKGIAWYLSLGAGAIAVGAMACMLVKYVCSFFTDVVDSLDSSSVQQHGQYTHEKNHRVPPKQTKISLKGAFNVGGLREKEVRTQRNLRLVRHRSGDMVSKVRALFLNNRECIINQHFYVQYLERKKLDEHVVLEVLDLDKKGKALGWKPLNIDEFCSRQIVDARGLKRDARLVAVRGMNITGVRDISNYVQTQAEFERLGSAEGHFIREDKFDTARVTNHIGGYGDCYFAVGACVYETQDGDCGSVYSHGGLTIERPIIGIHAISLLEATKIAFVPMISEEIEEARKQLSRVVQPIPILEDASLEAGQITVIEEVDIPMEPTITLHGKTKMNSVELVKFNPMDTSFMRTPLQHPSWTDNFRPSVKRRGLVDGVMVDPLMDGCQKYKWGAQRCFPTAHSLLVTRWFCKIVGTNESARTLTEFEAINGIEGLQKLVMNTSPGFFSLYFKDGKHEIFEVISEDPCKQFGFSTKAKTFVIPSHNMTLCEIIDSHEQKLSRGEVPVFLWNSTLKDELLKIKKVEERKTRVFESPEIVFTYLIRKYFGAFSAYFGSRPGFACRHLIGNDKEAVWGDVYRELKKFGGNGFDVDYSKYDATVQAQAFDFFLSVSDHYYTGNDKIRPQDRVIRHGLIRALQNSYQIVDRVLIETYQGNKSGFPLTDRFNTICNIYVIMNVYLILRRAAGLSVSLDSVDEDFGFLTYGDDVIVGATDECLQYFNRELFVEVANMIGMQATAADKAGVIRPFDPIEDLTFLKAPFVQREGYVACPLPMEVIHRELRWQKRVHDGDLELLKLRVKDASDFAKHHGREKFDQLREQLAELNVHIDDDFDTWECEMRAKQLNGFVERANGSKLDWIGFGQLKVDYGLKELSDLASGCQI